jgi:hypothetical protein
MKWSTIGVPNLQFGVEECILYIFMITWTVFKNHFLEVGPTQNLETMALRTTTTIDSFYFIICEDMHE